MQFYRKGCGSVDNQGRIGTIQPLYFGLRSQLRRVLRFSKCWDSLPSCSNRRLIFPRDERPAGDFRSHPKRHRERLDEDQRTLPTGFFCFGLMFFSRAWDWWRELCRSIQFSSNDRLKRQRLPSLNAGIKFSDEYLYRLSGLMPRYSAAWRMSMTSRTPQCAACVSAEESMVPVPVAFVRVEPAIFCTFCSSFPMSRSLPRKTLWILVIGRFSADFNRLFSVFSAISNESIKYCRDKFPNTQLNVVTDH